MENSLSNREKIEKLQNSINIINNQLKVRKPQPSIKSLFNGKHPKNRLNLKKMNPKITQKNKNEIKRISQKNFPSIKSLIKNSKDNEFLNSENNFNFRSTKIIPIVNYPSSTTLYSLKSNNNINNFNSNKNNNIINNSINTNINPKQFYSTESLPKLDTKPSKPSTQSSNETKSTSNNKQEKDLNQLYQEYIQNVSKYLI